MKCHFPASQGHCNLHDKLTSRNRIKAQNQICEQEKFGLRIHPQTRAWEAHDHTGPAAPTTSDSASRFATTESWFQEPSRAGDEVRPNAIASVDAFH